MTPNTIKIMQINEISTCKKYISMQCDCHDVIFKFIHVVAGCELHDSRVVIARCRTPISGHSSECPFLSNNIFDEQNITTRTSQKFST